VVKILRLRRKITISATHQSLLAPSYGIHPNAPHRFPSRNDSGEKNARIVPHQFAHHATPA
jgi:hypothetical protein